MRRVDEDCLLPIAVISRNTNRSEGCSMFCSQPGYVSVKCVFKTPLLNSREYFYDPIQRRQQYSLGVVCS